MKRRLFTLAPLLSLLLSAATAVLWVRSYWRADVIGMQLPRNALLLGWSCRGGMTWWWFPSSLFETPPSESRIRFGSNDAQEAADGLSLLQNQSQWETDRNWLLFRVTSGSTLGATGRGGLLGIKLAMVPARRFIVPHWIVAALFALPLFAVVSRLRRKWLLRRQGRCAQCGYNLTGNTSGVCSECGAAIPAEAKP